MAKTPNVPRQITLNFSKYQHFMTSAVRVCILTFSACLSRRILTARTNVTMATSATVAGTSVCRSRSDQRPTTVSSTRSGQCWFWSVLWLSQSPNVRRKRTTLFQTRIHFVLLVTCWHLLFNFVHELITCRCCHNFHIKFLSVCYRL